MVAMAPARQIERTANEATSKVVPVADLVLETFQNGRMIRQQHLDTIYRTVTSNRPTRHLTEITSRTVAGNAADLAAGRTVDAKTLHGRKVAEITVAPATAVAVAAPATKAPTARAMTATLADLIAPTLPRANNNTLFTAPIIAAPLFAAATKAALSALMTPEAPNEKKERENKNYERQLEEREEAARLAAARSGLDRARNEIAAKLQTVKTANPGADRPAALAAEAAISGSRGATPEAALMALENARAIEARIEITDDKRENTATPLQTKRAEQVAAIAHAITLADRYETEGAEGHFKALILEATTALTPAPEALATFTMLNATPFGHTLIAQVEQDRAELAVPAAGNDAPKAAPERATPFAEIFEGFDLAALSFPAGMRRHAPEAKAALAA